MERQGLIEIAIYFAICGVVLMFLVLSGNTPDQVQIETERFGWINDAANQAQIENGIIEDAWFLCYLIKIMDNDTTKAELQIELDSLEKIIEGFQN